MLLYNFPTLAAGHGIGIPLTVFLNQQLLGIHRCTGNYVMAGCMVIGIIIFQLGHVYRRFLKNKRSQKKLAEINKSNEVEVHKKSCPKYLANHYLPRESFLEKKEGRPSFDKCKHRTHLNDEELDDFNMSDDSSNYDELDDDEGNIP